MSGHSFLGIFVCFCFLPGTPIFNEKFIWNFVGLGLTLVLFPRMRIRANVKDFRPISLITSVYKIIAKILEDGLRKVLFSTLQHPRGFQSRDMNLSPSAAC